MGKDTPKMDQLITANSHSDILAMFVQIFIFCLLFFVLKTKSSTNNPQHETLIKTQQIFSPHITTPFQIKDKKIPKPH
jgi:hypothetical protein